jgi:hypothetical protein
MAKKETTKEEAKKDHVMYVGAHPHVAIGDVGEFPRREARGPFSEETIKLLTKEDVEDKPKGWKPEFVRCTAPLSDATSSADGTTATAPAITSTEPAAPATEAQ